MAQDRPTAAELLAAIADFLREEATPVLDRAEPRLGFQMRVAANSLDIIMREISLGPEARAFEAEALRGLVGEGRDLQTQRENLCQAIRFGEIDLQRADLHAYLRQSVFAQVMIDQPGYAGAFEAGKRLT
jgi:hypothetical protein